MSRNSASAALRVLTFNSRRGDPYWRRDIAHQDLESFGTNASTTYRGSERVTVVVGKKSAARGTSQNRFSAEAFQEPPHIWSLQNIASSIGSLSAATTS